MRRQADYRIRLEELVRSARIPAVEQVETQAEVKVGADDDVSPDIAAFGFPVGSVALL